MLRRRRPLFLALGLLLLILSGVFGLLGWLAKREPGFYTAAACPADYDTREKASRLLTRVQDLKNDIRTKPEWGETFTADVDYVPFDGGLVRGRQAVVDSHDRLFRGVLSGSALVGQVESIRHVGSDVAIVHTLGSVLMPWRSKLPKRRLSRQTVVAVRTSEGWRFTAFHNTRVRPVRNPAPDSLPSRASRAMTRVARRLGVGRH